MGRYESAPALRRGSSPACADGPVRIRPSTMARCSGAFFAECLWAGTNPTQHSAMQGLLGRCWVPMGRYESDPALYRIAMLAALKYVRADGPVRIRPSTSRLGKPLYYSRLHYTFRAPRISRVRRPSSRATFCVANACPTTGTNANGSGITTGGARNILRISETFNDAVAGAIRTLPPHAMSAPRLSTDPRGAASAPPGYADP